MKRSFKLENLECANCAAKMETGINKLDGVKATVSFMTQRLDFEADESIFEERFAQAQKVVQKIEPDCKITKR